MKCANRRRVKRVREKSYETQCIGPRRSDKQSVFVVARPRPCLGVLDIGNENAPDFPSVRCVDADLWRAGDQSKNK
jgi:hypothetical protein